MDKAARAALLTAKGMDNKSENIADYVADLLRQGRAKEVTDDLMAQADPQRLHQHYISGNTGMDLPMDYASRMARAAAMGFNTGNKLYHGSVRDFNSFIPSQSGKLGPGVYMTPNERKAGIFSGYEYDNNPRIEKLLNEGNEKSSQVYGLLATNRPVTMEARQAVRTNESAYDDRAEHYRKKFDEMGFDGVSVADERTILDPTKIRSQFARFDPRLEHLAHLSASTGGAMDFARHVEAVQRAGGQIAPSKYLPNVPRQVHAGGGRIHAEGGGKMELRSRAANVVSGLQQKRGNVDELLSMLAKGKVKAAELINAGRPFGHSVSKEELAEHFRNAVPQVGVERLGGMDSNQYTRFDDYFLPGAKNYREHLLTLQNREGHTPFVYPWHWGDRKNILAHVRMADRDNGDTLHVGEVQSDWGQHARQRGYYDPTKPFRVYNKDTHETKKLASNQFEARDEAIKSGSRYGVEPSINYYPPAGPYIGDTQQWTDLALKHILTEAAKNGHKRIVFSPGEHSADMYKQRWKIDSFRLHRNPEGSDTLGTLAPYDKDGFLTASGFTPVKDEKDLADQIGEEHAAKLLASPLKSLPRSNMLVDQWQKGDPAPEPTHTLSEPDMHLGGQGMIKYYKRNVNAGVLKLLRQHDPSIQPESYDLPSDPEAGNREGYKGFGVPMTDTARESILKNGWEAYKDGGAVDDALALTRRFSKDGIGATVALKSKGK